MPKISTKTAKKVLPKSLPYKESRYTTVPFSEAIENTVKEVRGLCNLQNCACDHDRCCHTDRIGTGDDQRLIIDAPNVGRCLATGCKCKMFVFSSTSSAEGKKRREQEKKIAKIYPPSDEDK